MVDCVFEIGYASTDITPAESVRHYMLEDGTYKGDNYDMHNGILYAMTLQSCWGLDTAKMS